MHLRYNRAEVPYPTGWYCTLCIQREYFIPGLASLTFETLQEHKLLDISHVRGSYASHPHVQHAVGSIIAPLASPWCCRSNKKIKYVIWALATEVAYASMTTKPHCARDRSPCVYGAFMANAFKTESFAEPLFNVRDGMLHKMQANRSRRRELLTRE